MWELDHKEGWALKNWCFQTVVLEKTHESPLDYKEIQPVHPKGNKPRIFIRRTDGEAPILRPSDVKSQLTGKDHDSGKDWRPKKRAAEDEMVGQHYRLNGHESEQTLENSKAQICRCAAVYEVTKSQTRLSKRTTNWTSLKLKTSLEKTSLKNESARTFPGWSSG